MNLFLKLPLLLTATISISSSVALSDEGVNDNKPTSETCKEFINQYPGVHVYRQRFNAETCYLSVNPADVNHMVYRSFLFSNFGALMVFNSYGDGNGSQYTGARLYYFFPRVQMPNLIVGNNNVVTISTSTPSVQLDFDSQTAKAVYISGGEITEAQEIRPDNKGGVEIDKVNALMLDVGYKAGADPATDLNANSVFKDHLGNSCQVKNNEVFKMNGDDVEIKFDDAELKKILATRCPTLQFLF